MTTLGVTNMLVNCLDSWSNSDAQMQTTTSPFTTAISRPSGLDGEVERLRYMWSHVMGYSQWYRHDENLQLRDRMVANHRGALTSAGEGLYRGQATLGANLRYHAVSYGFENQGAHHETALMLIHVGATARFMVSLGGDVHALSTMATGPGAQRFPAYATARWHGTGLWFPSDGQLGISVGGDSPYRFHATGFMAHAILFMHAGSGQYTAFVAHANSSVTRTYRLPQTFGTQGQALAMGPNAGGFADLEWTNVAIALPVSVASGGTGLTSGTSGGILGFTASGTLASSAALTANALVLGGGAGATPTVLGSLGTTTTVLHGNAAGAPSFGAVSLSADVTGNLPVANLNSGTGAGATTFWRGDATWATASSLETGVYVNETGVKVAGTIYQNTSGRKRRVYQNVEGAGSGKLSALVEVGTASPPTIAIANLIIDVNAAAVNHSLPVSYEVPNNNYYRLTITTGSVTRWVEIDE